MTKLLAPLLACAVLSIASCKSDDYSPDKIIAMEKAALDRWGKGDPQGYLEIMDADLTYFDPFKEKRLDGLDTMKEIRKIESCRNLPIVAVTAKAMVGDRERCLEAGAWDYLSKPVDREQLLAVLRAWLQR